jgi:hypothetical protein
MADLEEQTPLERLFRRILVEEIIEKVFRFFEMIVIATLIGVAVRVVWVGGSEWVVSGLALAAGLYLGVPTARWLVSLFPPSKGSRLLLLAVISLFFGMTAIQMTSGLRILLSETFKIDEPAARIDYQLWKARSGAKNCFNPRSAEPPDEKKIAACERRWESEIGRLEAEKQALK